MKKEWEAREDDMDKEWEQAREAEWKALEVEWLQWEAAREAREAEWLAKGLAKRVIKAAREKVIQMAIIEDAIDRTAAQRVEMEAHTERLFAWSDREHAKLEADRAALERERELLTHEPRGSYGYYEYPREPCCCCIVLYNYD